MTITALASTPRRRLRILRRPTESIRPAMPRPERRDCHGRLSAALLGLAGEEASMEAASLRPWCSATFVGAQHRFTLRLMGEDAAHQAGLLTDMLPEAEMTLPGHIVADLSVDVVETRTDGATISLSILTIEAW